jgi:hypothetical protein
MTLHARRRELLKGITLGAAALIAGLTNVLLLSSGGGEQNFGSFPEFGIPGLHAIGHGQGFGTKTYEDCFVELRQFHCRLIAGLATRLQNMREGNGTMLDNTVIVYRAIRPTVIIPPATSGRPCCSAISAIGCARAAALSTSPPTVKPAIAPSPTSTARSCTPPAARATASASPTPACATSINRGLSRNSCRRKT